MASWDNDPIAAPWESDPIAQPQQTAPSPDRATLINNARKTGAISSKEAQNLLMQPNAELPDRVANLPGRSEATGQGLTLGLSDEIAGLFGGSQARDQARSDLASFQQQHPWQAMGDQVLGSLPLSMIPMGGAKAGATTFQQGVNAAKVAAPMGAAYGFNTGQGGFVPRAENAGKAGAVAAATAFAYPFVYRGLESGAQALKQKFLTGAGPTPAASAAREAGYVIPPNMQSDNPSLVSKGLSAFSGKIKTAQAASQANQDVTNQLAADALGVKPGTALTEDVFDKVRKDAGQAYEAVKTSIPMVKADDAFKTAVGGLNEVDPETAFYFPEITQNKQIDNLSTTLGGKDEFSPAAAVGLVRRLRYDASANLKNAQDPEKFALGMAQRKAADAVDDLVERNLDAAGKVGLVDEYRSARRLIAISHDLESATNAATGDVDARKLAVLANRGRPFTGNLEAIAKTAQAFPKAMQNPASFGGVEPLSIFDVMAAGGAAAAGRPEVSAGLLSRPVIRGTLLSAPYQNMIARTPQAVVHGSPGFLASPQNIAMLSALLRQRLEQTANEPGNAYQR